MSLDGHGLTRKRLEQAEIPAVSLDGHRLTWKRLEQAEIPAVPRCEVGRPELRGAWTERKGKNMDSTPDLEGQQGLSCRRGSEGETRRFLHDFE